MGNKKLRCKIKTKLVATESGSNKMVTELFNAYGLLINTFEGPAGVATAKAEKKRFDADYDLGA